ncbi:YbaB/EbfC family nucleoid-associated protein [Saccharopolyspora mangrovi]|uniref:YbaB/EbfC family nucleoid-associated protein n=1 Tax=Saccharopolyspora mangrovi TaxID=3082379 RepID=A0ABU6A7L9_9PSEU|nr:YbaB/EbfC family nucleoid-associated protein [Saccharopolyspora sp. S2-29]MEB3367567.1 YbaB/EbfC family nucleoid-associated protein [Saccharopolyspora sp. S2-29]
MSGPAERIQEMLRDFEEQAAKATQLQSAVQDMRGTASSEDRSVTVSVAPSGAVLDLQLAPNAVRKQAHELQQQIMDAIRRATANAADQMNEAVAPVLGDRFAQFQEAFSAQTSVLKPGEDQPPRPRTSAADEDEDFGNGSLLR